MHSAFPLLLCAEGKNGVRFYSPCTVLPNLRKPSVIEPFQARSGSTAVASAWPNQCTSNLQLVDFRCVGRQHAVHECVDVAYASIDGRSLFRYPSSSSLVELAHKLRTIKQQFSSIILAEVKSAVVTSSSLGLVRSSEDRKITCGKRKIDIVLANSLANVVPSSYYKLTHVTLQNCVHFVFRSLS